MTAQVVIVGNLTKDPDLRFTPSGDAVANFTVAVNERVKEGNDWKDGEASFYEVKAWRKLGEQVAETLTKGTRVIVSGKMKIDKYEAKDGGTRYSTVINADEVGKSIRFGDKDAPMPIMTTREPDPWASEPEGIPPF
jgi:single-strand DNA-binding protein